VVYTYTEFGSVFEK